VQKIYRFGQSIDHYTIIRLLGSGGASRVYLARDQHTLHEIVLKFPNEEEIGGTAVFARYKREAKIGGHLIHPGIQCHLNKGEPRSADYLVLEYLQGTTLRTAMLKYAPQLLPQPDVIRIIITLCETLIYVHEQGVIHQDIKPENVFLLETGEIKLLDFGISLLEGENRPEGWWNSSNLIGTPDYMAPERLRGKQGSIRSDTYAVGIMLFELLCGRTPFEETDGFALVSQHTSHDPPDILRFNPELSPALATVVMSAIRRDPEKRYSCVEKLIYDLSHLEEITPIAYAPDQSLLGGAYRQIIRLAFLVLLTCSGLIAFGILMQLAHHTIH
jgi:eukaryotic-like serine/threonine-protein kinase